MGVSTIFSSAFSDICNGHVNCKGRFVNYLWLQCYNCELDFFIDKKDKLNAVLLHVEIDFLSKRQQDWEDSFQSLYFMLRKGLCNIFYGIHLILQN